MHNCVCVLCLIIYMFSLSPYIVAIPGRRGSLSVPRLFGEGQRPGCSSPQALQCPAHSKRYIQPLPGKDIHACSECIFKVNCVYSNILCTTEYIYTNLADAFIYIIFMTAFNEKEGKKLEFLYQWEARAIWIPRQYFCGYKMLLNWLSSWILGGCCVFCNTERKRETFLRKLK